MIKYLLFIPVLAGCLENPFERNCDLKTVHYPDIGGCIENADPGTPGGSCLPTFGGYTCNDTYSECIDGTCYACGKANEPCCGNLTQAGSGGTCLDGEGQCAISTQGEGWFTCQGGATSTPPGQCEPGVQPNYFVAVIDSQCISQELVPFCADNDGDATLWADANTGPFHGPVSTDPDMTRSAYIQECGQGHDCISGGGDGSLSSGFNYFPSVTGMLTTCEHNREPVTECTNWLEATNGNCPAAAM